MQAYTRVSSSDQIVQLDTVAMPQTSPEQVLIKVKAFGVGIHDRYFIPADVVFPYVIGSEWAWVITQIWSEVKEYKIGDRVIFTTILQKQGGSRAQYAVAGVDALIMLPEEVSFVQGAAISVAGKTALECIRELDIQTGDKVFIAGASGAIGTLAIQLAVQQWAIVGASASHKNHEYMKSLWAEKTVDYSNPTWKDQIMERSTTWVDKVLAIQPWTGVDSISIIKEWGLLITVSWDHTQITPERNITIRQMGHKQETQEQMIDLVQAVAWNKVAITIEHEYPFEQALDALTKTETRHARWKVVVTID